MLFNLPIIKLANVSVFEFSDFQIFVNSQIFGLGIYRCCLVFTLTRYFLFQNFSIGKFFNSQILRTSEFFDPWISKHSNSRASELLNRESSNFEIVRTFTHLSIRFQSLLFVQFPNFRILFESSDFRSTSTLNPSAGCRAFNSIHP